MPFLPPDLSWFDLLRAVLAAVVGWFAGVIGSRRSR
jgi:hypothetical protein